MTKEDFNKEQHALRKQLLDIRFDQRCGKLTNTAMIRKTRRDLARLLTLKRLSNG
jgi:ribosomal protein L29